MSRPVRLGRTYRCKLCGARVMVIRAASQALDPHCCNQAMEAMEAVAAVYRCELCGSEVAVLSDRGGSLELVCCHQSMERRPSPIPEAA